MAEENLGTAVLTIEIRDQQAKDALSKLRQDIDAINKSAGSVGAERTPRGQRTATASGSTATATTAEDKLIQARRRASIAADKATEAEQRRTREATARRRNDVISNALIGGAFPLLFGQGAGSAVGGAVGGGLGGALGGTFGFGGSLVGTALGAAFDAAIEKTKTLADAFNSPIKNFDALKEAALLSSKSVEKNAEALINAGRTQEASILIQEDLQRTYGDTESAEKLLEANENLKRAWSEVSTATGLFVAGPLAEFLKKLRERITPPETPQQVRDRTAEQNRVANTLKNVGFGVAGLGFGVAASGVGVVPGLATAGVGGAIAGIGTAIASQPAPRQRAEKPVDPKQEERRAAAAAAYQKLLQQENLLIVAQTQGYEDIATSLERQVILARASAAAAADPVNALKIRRDAQKELIQLDERELERAQDLYVQRNLITAQSAIQLQNIGRQVAATQALSKAERGVARDTLATTQNIQAGIDAAKDREREIGAQIDAARQRGGDAGEQEAFRLVQEQKVAANQTRLELEKGALALKEAGEQLRDNLRDAVVEFTRVRSDPQGLNRFLNQQQIQQRAEIDFQTLLPQFREAQRLFEKLTGQRAPEFTGPTASVNEAIRNFILRTQLESQATRDLTGTQQALNTNLEAYTKTIADLAVVTKELALKRWDVNLILPNGSSVPYANEQNAAFPLS